MPAGRNAVVLLAACFVAGWSRPLCAQQFADVPLEHFAFRFIEALADSGITGGCGAGNFCPDEPVTRAQMAVFLERGMNGSDYSPPPASGSLFVDVGAGDFAADFIEALYADGITGGCGSGSYCPNAAVTRAQMAVFLLRASYGRHFVPAAATGVFGDVPPGSFADRFIERLAADGITSGCGGGDFCPGDPVTRAQMAVFLVRAFDLPIPPPPADNVNITDPTLILAENMEVGVGGDLDLVWSDEFEGPQLDPERWFFETGDGSQYGIPGWGNNELQWYEPNSAQLRNGLLVITAREESRNGFAYTSARINTRDRFAFRYGRIEARIRLPGGQGLWPAFWLLPQDNVYGTWAASGEIDIMEAINLDVNGANSVTGTLHYGAQWPGNVFSGSEYLVPTSATAEFHEYALEWDATEMRWYVDDVLYAVQNSWYTTGAPFPAPFDQYFYVLFNVAVGGNYPGAPNAGTVFPVTLEVDYVRVYSGTR